MGNFLVVHVRDARLGGFVTKRLEFPRKVREAIIARANGHCEKCGAVLKPSEGELDHILPDGLKGKPVAANGQWICRVCHYEKTKDDVRRMRKADRQRDKATGAKRAKGRKDKPPKGNPEKLAGLGPSNLARRFGA